MKKLHLGCGNRYLEGYINIDIRSGANVDIVADIRNLNFEPESVDLIYNCAVLEHFGRHEWFDILKHWTSLLKPNGKMYISTTDFDALVERYKNSKSLEELLGFLIGGQKYEYDFHGMVFNFDILFKAMQSLGFKDIQRYDWRTHDVGIQGVDDYSQAYLPHMDKANGTLMVLNICGVKS